MRTTLIVLACLAPILLLAATPFAVASFGNTIHPFQHGTTISRTSYPGEKVGCLTSGKKFTLEIDFYYTDNADNDQRITSLTLESSTDGGITWTPVVSGVTWNPSTLPIDVPWSGKTGIGQLVTTDPHTTVAVTFPVTGDIGDLFYYRVHFTSVYATGQPGNAGNHYFYYDICGKYVIPEFGEPSIIAFMAILMTFAYFHLHRRKIPSLLPK